MTVLYTRGHGNIQMDDDISVLMKLKLKLMTKIEKGAIEADITIQPANSEQRTGNSGGWVGFTTPEPSTNLHWAQTQFDAG